MDLTHGTRGYTLIPIPITADMRDLPVALAVYALIGRVWRVTHAPVPLAAGDLCRLDPSCSYGAARRALQRLVACGWLEADTSTHKHGYRPLWGWGRRGQTPLPWNAQAKTLGCPRNVMCVRLDDALLDIYLGRLTPHPRHPTIERYWSEPLLGLRDIGGYVLGLIGMTSATEPLHTLGLVRDGRSLPLPERTTDLLAALTQRTLWAETPTPSASTLTRLGVSHPPVERAETGQPLFFVPSSITTPVVPLIPSMIASSITRTGADHEPDSAFECGTMDTSPDSKPAPWIQRSQRSQRSHHHHRGGGEQPAFQQEPTGDDHVPTTVPSTESTRLLQALPILPQKVVFHTNTAPAQVRAAIALAQARSDIRDQAAFVVSLLDRHRDSGWDVVAAQEARQQARSGPWTATEVARYRTGEEQAQVPADALPDLPSVPIETGGSSVCWTAAGQEFGARDARLAASLLDEQSLRATLRSALPRTAWPVIDVLQIVLDAQRCELRFSSHQHFVQYATEVRAIVRSELAEAGAVREVVAVHHVARPVVDQASDPSVDGGRPEWIDPDQWRTLPPLLRVALRGAERVDGQIVARSPHAQRQIDWWGAAW